MDKTQQDKIMKAVSGLKAGDRFCYYIGNSFWVPERSDLNSYFLGLQYGGRHTFAQRYVGIDNNGAQVFEYWVWRLRGQ